LVAGDEFITLQVGCWTIRACDISDRGDERE